MRHRSGSRSYTYYLTQSLWPAFEQFEAEGTVFGAVTKHDLHAIRVIAPPLDLVQLFDHLCAPVDGQIEACEAESRTLAALRDTLLPKLISGELRIKDAERFVGKVV